jgi:hypothetical protein
MRALTLKSRTLTKSIVPIKGVCISLAVVRLSVCMLQLVNILHMAACQLLVVGQQHAHKELMHLEVPLLVMNAHLATFALTRISPR